MTRHPKPVIHGRDHAPGGADPIPNWPAGGVGAPLITDYFNNASTPFMLPSTVHDTAGLGAESWNWIRWEEQANWSGYPNPWIAVDKVTTGNDSLGVSQVHRWVYLPTKGTDTDFTSSGGSALVKVEFSMEMTSSVADKWFDVTINTIKGAGPGAWDTPNIGTALLPVAGWRSDFPVCSTPQITAPHTFHASPSLEFYTQLASGIYTGFGAILYQSLPGGVGDFENDMYCQMNVTLLKNDAFAGGVF